MVLNFSYLALKLPNFKLIGKKLFQLESQVFHRFDIIVSRKKLLKVLAFSQAHCMICLFFSTPKIIEPIKITSCSTVSNLAFCEKLNKLTEVMQLFLKFMQGEIQLSKTVWISFFKAFSNASQKHRWGKEK